MDKIKRRLEKRSQGKAAEVREGGESQQNSINNINVTSVLHPGSVVNID